MPDDFIGLDVTGIKEVQKMLALIPPEVQDVVVDKVDDYMLNVLRLYPKPRHIKRKTAYGVTFFSDKQRRYYFWALREGIINVPYKRTQTLARGWRVLGKGKQSIIANETPYADLVMGKGQSRMMSRIGWHTIPRIIKDRIARITEIANATAQRGIESAKRKAGVKYG